MSALARELMGKSYELRAARTLFDTLIKTIYRQRITCVRVRRLVDMLMVVAWWLVGVVRLTAKCVTA